MPPSFLFYVLFIYFLYHVLNRSELLGKPRDYLLRVLPWWTTKPITCAFCFSWWAAVLIAVADYLFSSFVVISTVNLMAAPVAVLILDLIVRKLLVPPEPPLIIDEERIKKMAQEAVADMKRPGGLL